LGVRREILPYARKSIPLDY
jgi:hypothetical protein